MTLDEAIKHCEDVAEDRCGCAEDCVEEHRQLAKWLKELKDLRACTDDLISREDVLNILRDYQSRQDVHIGMPSDSDVYAYARGMLIGICNNIKDIPSAQPNWFEDAIPPKDKEIRINGNGCVFMSAKTFKELKPKTGEWIAVDSYSAFGGDESAWIAHGNPTAYHYCSNCKEQTYADEFGKEILSDFCPSCGARMTERSE